jgi:hypothetical protein
MRALYWGWMLLVLGTAALGCGGDGPAAESDAAADEDVGSAYLAASEPAGASSVGVARQRSKAGEPITLVGTIGGSPAPFVEGLAAFTLVDSSIPYCSEDEGCPTPWDYCCTQDQVREKIATVKIINEAGSPVMRDARELLGVAELDEVVVSGTAERDAEGNLSVAAKQIFIRR